MNVSVETQSYRGSIDNIPRGTVCSKNLLKIMLPKNSLLIRRLTCLSILLLLSPLAHALEIKGVRLPKRIKANENELVLNGGALRSVWGFKVYVAGLYLKKNSKDEKHIMAEDRESKRIHITMLREVSGKKFECFFFDNPIWTD